MPPFRINAADDLTMIRDDKVSIKKDQQGRNSILKQLQPFRKKPKNQEWQAVNAQKKAAKDITEAPILERHTTQ